MSINGSPVLTNLDIFATAGEKEKAVVEDFPAIQSDPNGNIVISFTNGAVDVPVISGIEIQAK